MKIDPFPRAVTLRLVYTGWSIMTEVKGDETVGDLVDSAAEYFRYYPEAFTLKAGKYILRKDLTMDDISVPHQGAVFEIIPDPDYNGPLLFEDPEAARRSAEMFDAIHKKKGRYASKNLKDGYWPLAQRIARYMEDYDPYGFMDALETGQTVEEGLVTASEEVYRVLCSDDFATVREWIYDPDIRDRRTKKEMKSILRELKKIERQHRRAIADNPLAKKR